MDLPERDECLEVTSKDGTTFTWVRHSDEALQVFARAIRKEVLEEAAKVCDAYAKEAWGYTEEEHAAQKLAEAIRALLQLS